MAGDKELPEAREDCYEIRLQGCLDDHWTSWFGGGLKLTRTSLTVLNQTWKNGEKCGDKPAEIQVKRNGSLITGDPGALRVPKDGWVTIAFAPKGADIPAPTDWEARVKKADGTAEGHQTTPTSAPRWRSRCRWA